MKPEIRKELKPIVCALGFLSIYAVENKKEEGHPIYVLIKDLQRIVKLYKSQYSEILEECFDTFDKIAEDKAIHIDTIAFSNAMLVFHNQMKNKKFHPSLKKINNFWLTYKQHMKASKTREQHKEVLATYMNSRSMASIFFEVVNGEREL